MEPCYDSLYRRMDIIMYVLYSKDERFVYDMVCKVTKEVAAVHNFAQLETLLQYPDRPILYRCLFFLLINFHADFRYWVLSENASKENGLPNICPHKASRFLQQLRENLVLQFLVREEMTMEEFDRNVKMTYVAS
jgi:hypothetical protein